MKLEYCHNGLWIITLSMLALLIDYMAGNFLQGIKINIALAKIHCIKKTKHVYVISVFWLFLSLFFQVVCVS